MSLPSHVQIVEVGPRDGLQNEQTPISTAVKVELCEKLLEAGVNRLEAAAFVSPKWVPQMADGLDVLKALSYRLGSSNPKPSLSALVPNMKGLEGALAGGVNEIVVFTAASEAFNQKNINCSVSESIERFKPVVTRALEAGLHVRGSISCALGCPYQGEVPVEAASDVATRLQDIGVHEFDVADTIGVGTAGRVQDVFGRVIERVGVQKVAAHFHDTYGQALANIFAVLQLGVAVVHSSIGGLGGCPYAKGATGNVATEDVVYLLHGLGIATGVELPKLIETGQWISQKIDRPYTSRTGRALLAKC